MLPTGTIGLEPILTVLETAALPVKLYPINTHKPVASKDKRNGAKIGNACLTIVSLSFDTTIITSKY